MRKLFRFRYEPCTGACYAWCIKLPTELRKLSEGDRRHLVNRMVAAHDQLCDNRDYSFGVDVDEINEVFVAHFRTPETTDLFSGKSFYEVVSSVCDRVIETPIPVVADECVYGINGNEDLGHEILKACTDEVFGELGERHCECKAHAIAA